MSTITLKLITGEEIIGRIEVNDPSKDVIILEKVRTIGVQQTGQGQMGIGLMPFAYSQHDGSIAIRRSAIMAEFTCDDRLEKVYLQQTSSIQLA